MGGETFMTVTYTFLIQRVHILGGLGGERREKERNIFWYSKECQAQGCSLATTGYGLLVLLLLRKVKKEFSDVESP